MAKTIEVQVKQDNTAVIFRISLLRAIEDHPGPDDFVHAYFLIKTPNDDYPLAAIPLRDIELHDTDNPRIIENLAVNMIERFIIGSNREIDLPLDLTMALRAEGWKKYRKEILPETIQ